MMRKLVFLQILSLVGFLFGAFIAPQSPIYPFAPTEADMAVIHRTEIMIICVLSACSVAFGIAGKFALKLTYAHVAVCSISCGVLAVLLESIRLGTFYLPSLSLIGSYFGVMMLLVATASTVNKMLEKQA